MPKMKTHSGSKKRFRITNGGKGRKIKARHPFTSHILEKKSPKRKRHLGNPKLVDGADVPRVRELLRK